MWDLTWKEIFLPILRIWYHFNVINKQPKGGGFNDNQDDWIPNWDTNTKIDISVFCPTQRDFCLFS